MEIERDGRKRKGSEKYTYMYVYLLIYINLEQCTIN